MNDAQWRALCVIFGALLGSGAVGRMGRLRHCRRVGSEVSAAGR